jgi:L-seryl-tRNA(Ser) seleniumtransferase
VTGFTEAPERAALVALGRERGVPVLEDLGSGALERVADEPSVRDVVAAGTDLVFFSGDKLLGGPQAGLAVGRRELVEKLRKHPLYRALRVDKVTLAALEATLGDHVAGVPTPVGAMISAAPDVLRRRAERLRDAIGRGTVADEASVVGGGTLPGLELPTSVVRLDVPRADAVAKALRIGRPAVVPRVREGAVLLDVRTVADEQVEPLARRVAEVLGRE